MSLVSKLGFYVDKPVQTRGGDLFRAGKVRVASATPWSLNARVSGGALYEVELKFADGDLTVTCDCPAFEKYGPCKHVWACVLEADRREALSEAKNSPTLNLVDGFEGEDFDDEEDEFDDLLMDFPTKREVAPRQSAGQPRTKLWREQLQEIALNLRLDPARVQVEPLPNGFEVAYIIDVPLSVRSAELALTLQCRNRKKSGEWTVFKEFRISPRRIAMLPDADDREMVAALIGAPDPEGGIYYGMSVYARHGLREELALRLLPRMAKLGRLWGIRESYRGTPSPLRWDGGAPWQFWARIARNQRDIWQVTGELRRGEERLSLADPAHLFASGFLLRGDCLARFEDGAAMGWIKHLSTSGPIFFSDRDRDEALGELLESPVVPRLDLDEELQFETRAGRPQFGLRLRAAAGETTGVPGFDATLLANYGTGFAEVKRVESRGIWIPEQRLYLERDREAEGAAWEMLRAAGVRIPAGWAQSFRVTSKQMPKVVRELIGKGWHVEAEGKAFRRAMGTRFEVTSGIDWFELHGEIQYDGQTLELPELLAAIRRGDGMVRLGDGSFGMLPEEWAEKFAPLAGLGTAAGDHLRFAANQAGLLDALLAAQPEVRVDEVFERARRRLRTFHGVKAARQPAGFRGKLRNYQLEGVGWIEFLREFGFGGVLADDMGVGKTAQVLAVLEQRREEGKGPSLVVAPRSLVFNWRQEAERFTPKLRVLEHAGLDRKLSRIDDHDLILTTYGTLQRDVVDLAGREFDYVVLDEAQAIKNAATVSAKAARLLKGRHRLALSGTPVENHLGELWSLFEFLNPGMLGEARALKLTGGLARNPSEETRVMLASALRPFILRRTKQQVAKELPKKTEQTIYCELEGEQREKYEELRDHYRANLLGGAGGAKQWNRMKIQVLEALLRLRQAACHPGLLDKKYAERPGAKFTTLLAQLEELREEGHKALVFSQFTSLLGLLKERLDEAGFTYEYLDGGTRDRQERVERFQNDAGCQLFLISLKAGGLGLNLTAAGYVFLLDPWWNPAVEAQAIDRAHRIGQTRNVFAYRLIAKDTVEEKVLELQKSKRELADAILSADNAVLRDLKREDLEMLLS